MRSIKNNRKPWVIALCVIIALIMVLPIYDVVNIVGDNRGSSRSPDIDPDSYMEDLKDEAERLENFIEEYGPTLAVLKELSGVYRTLSYFITEDEVDYREKAALAMEKAIELEPADPESYLILRDIYKETGKTAEAEEKAITAEALLMERLNEDPGDNISRYYYSILLDDYHQDTAAAREQLEIIMDTEPEESQLYLTAKNKIDMIDASTEQDNSGAEDEE